MNALEKPGDEDDDYGPAMSALNPRQRVFIEQYLNNGGVNAQDAARKAGYDKGSQGSLDVQAYRLIRDKKVLAGLREETLKRMNSFGPEMFEVIVGIARDPAAPAGERRKSAEAVLDRIGLQAVSEHVVTVQDGRSRADLLREFFALAKEADVDVGRLMGGRSAPMIDVSPAKVEE